MKTAPREILVSSYHAAVPGKKKGEPVTRMELRWRAELVGGHVAVEGCQNIASAIGDLVLAAALHTETHAEFFDLVASMFGDITRRTASETLGRAIRFANENTRRKHAGARVRVEQPADQPSAAHKPRSLQAVKGGAA